jgi:hypothetical protein
LQYEIQDSTGHVQGQLSIANPEMSYATMYCQKSSSVNHDGAGKAAEEV